MKAPAAVYREEDALGFFWAQSKDPAVDRIWLLQELAKVKVVQRHGRVPEQVREESKAVRKRVDATFDKCFVCRSGSKLLIWHHIVQVQHGGSARLANQVGICEECHADVHPWLPKVGRLRNAWTWVGDLIVPWCEEYERMLDLRDKKA